MSLPLQVIERLFERLVATYGQEFVNKYQGDLNQVKSVWAHELGGFAHNLHSIAFALENLPERAPNVIEFRNICYRSPKIQEEKMIERPKVDPAIVAMIVKGLKPLPQIDRLDWARKIIANPQGRTPTVLMMAKSALETEKA